MREKTEAGRLKKSWLISHLNGNRRETTDGGNRTGSIGRWPVFGGSSAMMAKVKKPVFSREN
jgi:hypothetical protein